MPEPSNDHIEQYAIRLPNGKLHSHQPGSYKVIDGGFIVYTEDEDAPPEPVVYETLDEVQRSLAKFQATAAHMGITEWLGRIETRRCSPFTDSRDGEGAVMMADLEKFLEDQ